MKYSQLELMEEGVWNKFIKPMGNLAKGAAKAGWEVAKFAGQTLDPNTYNTLAGAASKVGALNKAVIKASTPLEQYVTKQLYQQGWKVVPDTMSELKAPGQSARKSAYNTAVGGGTPKAEKKYLIKVQELELGPNNKMRVKKDANNQEIPAKTIIINADGQKSSMETAEEKAARLAHQATINQSVQAPTVPKVNTSISASSPNIAGPTP